MKVEAVKPVFYKRWHHPGEEFDCDQTSAKVFEKDGKIKKVEKTKTNKQDKKK